MGGSLCINPLPTVQEGWMTSTATGQWSGMIHSLTSGRRFAVSAPHEEEWVWPHSGSTCMLPGATTAVPRCRLWRGEEGLSAVPASQYRSLLLVCLSDMILMSTSGQKWHRCPRGGREWVWSPSTATSTQWVALTMRRPWTPLRGGSLSVQYTVGCSLSPAVLLSLLLPVTCCAPLSPSPYHLLCSSLSFSLSPAVLLSLLLPITLCSSLSFSLSPAVLLSLLLPVTCCAPLSPSPCHLLCSSLLLPVTCSPLSPSPCHLLCSSLSFSLSPAVLLSLLLPVTCCAPLTPSPCHLLCSSLSFSLSPAVLLSLLLPVTCCAPLSPSPCHLLCSSLSFSLSPAVLLSLLLPVTCCAPLSPSPCASDRYNPQTNSWQFMTPMHVCRGGVGLSTLGGYLFAVGGHDGKAYLNTAEMYCPKTNLWKPVASMATSRAGAGVIAFPLLSLTNGSSLTNTPPESLESL